MSEFIASYDPRFPDDEGDDAETLLVGQITNESGEIPNEDILVIDEYDLDAPYEIDSFFDVEIEQMPRFVEDLYI